MEIGITSVHDNLSLLVLDNLVSFMTTNSVEHFHLIPPQRNVSNMISTEIARELNYDVAYLTKNITENKIKILSEQRNAHEAVLRCIEETKEIFCLDAPGDTGKTFVTNTLLAKIRRQRKIDVAVELSAISAILLDGGRTAHSAFTLPLNIAS